MIQAGVIDNLLGSLDKTLFKGASSESFFNELLVGMMKPEAEDCCLLKSMFESLEESLQHPEVINQHPQLINQYPDIHDERIGESNEALLGASEANRQLFNIAEESVLTDGSVSKIQSQSMREFSSKYENAEMMSLTDLSSDSSPKKSDLWDHEKKFSENNLVEFRAEERLLESDETTSINDQENNEFFYQLKQVQPQAITKDEKVELSPIKQEISKINDNELFKVVKMNHDDGVVEINLEPDQMGEMNIMLKVGKNNELKAHFLAENSLTRHMIEQRVPELREILAESGLSLSEFSVSYQQGDRHPSYHQESSFYQKQNQQNFKEETKRFITSAIDIVI